MSSSVVVAIVPIISFPFGCVNLICDVPLTTAVTISDNFLLVKNSDHLDGMLFVDRVENTKSLCTWDNFEMYHKDKFVSSITAM